MKKAALLIFVICIIAVSFAACSPIKSESPNDGSPNAVTGNDGSMNDDAVTSTNANGDYDSVIDYASLVPTAHITSAQIAAIKAGTAYKDIVTALGETKDIGSGLHVLQYAVDGDKILYLSFADENDVCAKSGTELLTELVQASQDGLPENTFRATLTQRAGEGILVSCPTYKGFDTIWLTITDDTVIQFSDGKSATIDDIQANLTITIGGDIAESYPPQGTALKIIIELFKTK